MREHKYRAWDKEYNHMYHTAWPFEHMVYVEMPSHDDQCNPLPINGNKFYNMNGKTFYFLTQKHVELMQYTGLKDKNGKEIFEGDIVCIDNVSLGAVEYRDGRFAINVDDFLFSFNNFAPVHIEVISNVYEHPELLKVVA